MFVGPPAAQGSPPVARAPTFVAITTSIGSNFAFFAMANPMGATKTMPQTPTPIPDIIKAVRNTEMGVNQGIPFVT